MPKLKGYLVQGRYFFDNKTVAIDKQINHEDITTLNTIKILH